MKSIIFQNKRYFVGNQIHSNTKKYSGFFFNKIIGDWYFIRVSRNWLARDRWIEYYLFMDPNVKEFIDFEDSIETSNKFIKSTKNKVEHYFEAVLLSDTLKKL